MQFSPKLKNAMKEIQAILLKYDIAANVVLHTPGHSEYLCHIEPSYSCAKRNGDMVRIRAKKEDFHNNEELRDQRLADTSNMFNLLADVTGRLSLQCITVSEQLDKMLGADHTDGGHTTDTTQNN